MENQSKKTSKTIFSKTCPTNIDSIKPGDIVYIKVNNPLRYGVRELEYYGRISKITDCYFWIAEYCNGYSLFGSECSCSTASCKRIDSMPEYRRKWRKTSLIEIWNSNSFIEE